MKVYGLESVQASIQNEHYLFKLVANEHAVCLFPHTTQHREAKQPGLSYEDDYQGNALAAMVSQGRTRIQVSSCVFRTACSQARTANDGAP